MEVFLQFLGTAVSNAILARPCVRGRPKPEVLNATSQYTSADRRSRSGSGGVTAEISGADFFVVEQVRCGSFDRHAAGFQDIATRCYRKGHVCVLLHQQDGGTASMDDANGGEQLLHDHGCESKRRLVE